jgi:hypothetical protein
MHTAIGLVGSGAQTPFSPVHMEPFRLGADEATPADGPSLAAAEAGPSTVEAAEPTKRERRKRDLDADIPQPPALRDQAYGGEHDYHKRSTKPKVAEPPASEQPEKGDVARPIAASLRDAAPNPSHAFVDATGNRQRKQGQEQQEEGAAAAAAIATTVTPTAAAVAPTTATAPTAAIAAAAAAVAPTAATAAADDDDESSEEDSEEEEEEEGSEEEEIVVDAPFRAAGGAGPSGTLTIRTNWAYVDVQWLNKVKTDSAGNVHYEAWAQPGGERTVLTKPKILTVPIEWLRVEERRNMPTRYVLSASMYQRLRDAVK